MIIGKLSESTRYQSLHPLFETAFNYLSSHDLLTMECGKIHIDGERLFVNNNNAALLTDCLPVEAHKRYIDIQIVLSGEERFGWVPVSDIKFNPYNPEKDVMLSDQKATTFFTLHAGEFVIFFPEDGHAPQGGKSDTFVRKAIVKVELNTL